MPPFVCFRLLSAENLKILMECPVSKQSIVELLRSENPAVQRACLALLRVYSEIPYGRRLAMANLNVHMWAILVLHHSWSKRNVLINSQLKRKFVEFQCYLFGQSRTFWPKRCFSSAFFYFPCHFTLFMPPPPLPIFLSPSLSLCILCFSWIGCED